MKTLINSSAEGSNPENTPPPGYTEPRTPWDFGPRNLCKAHGVGVLRWCLLGYPALPLHHQQLWGLSVDTEMGTRRMVSVWAGVTGAHSPPLFHLTSITKQSHSPAQQGRMKECASTSLVTFYSEHLADRGEVHSWVTSSWGGCSHQSPSTPPSNSCWIGAYFWQMALNHKGVPAACSCKWNV